MARLGGLTDVVEQTLPSVETTTAAYFVRWPATVAAYLRRQPEHRAEVLRRVHAVLPDQVDVVTTVPLTLSRPA